MNLNEFICFNNKDNKCCLLLTVERLEHSRLEATRMHIQRYICDTNKILLWMKWGGKLTIEVPQISKWVCCTKYPYWTTIWTRAIATTIVWTVFRQAKVRPAESRQPEYNQFRDILCYSDMQSPNFTKSIHLSLRGKGKRMQTPLFH